MRISILAPSRGRIKRMCEMRDSALMTAKYPGKLEFVFRIDRDDQDTIDNLGMLWKSEVLKHRKRVTSLSIQVILGERGVLSGKWNDCWERASGDIFMLGADDIIFRTGEWDDKIVSEFLKFPDRIAVVFAHDGFSRNESGHRGFATHPFVHKNWTDVLGYFARPYFPRHGTDTWIDDIGRRLFPKRGRHIGLNECLIEHMHYRQGKSENDQTYRDQVAHGTVHRQIWEDTGDERLEAILKLRKFIEEYAETSPNHTT